MRGTYTQHLLRTSTRTPAIERARALDKEAAELRLARIQNGCEPSHKNGTPWEQAQAIAGLAKEIGPTR